MNNTTPDFEEYLREQHMADYTGTDDDAPDKFVEWTELFDYEDWITFANLYAISQIKMIPCGLFDSTPYIKEFIKNLEK